MRRRRVRAQFRPMLDRCSRCATTAPYSLSCTIADFFFGGGGGAAGLSARGPLTFHDCVHSGLPFALYSPPITTCNRPSGVTLPATENTPVMPSTIVLPDLDFALILPPFAGMPLISGVRSMSTVRLLPFLATVSLPCG